MGVVVEILGVVVLVVMVVVVVVLVFVAVLTVVSFSTLCGFVPRLRWRS